MMCDDQMMETDTAQALSTDEHLTVPILCLRGKKIRKSSHSYGKQRFLSPFNPNRYTAQDHPNNIDVLSLSETSPNNNQNLKAALLIRSIPPHLNTVGQLKKYFSNFGTVVNIEVCYENDPKSAFVQFSSISEATAALRCKDPVLNNRFIGVFRFNNTENRIDKRTKSGENICNKNSSEHSVSGKENHSKSKSLSLDSMRVIADPNKMLKMISEKRKAIDESLQNQKLLLKKLDAARTTKEKQQIKKLLIFANKEVKSNSKLIETIHNSMTESSTCKKNDESKQYKYFPSHNEKHMFIEHKNSKNGNESNIFLPTSHEDITVDTSMDSSLDMRNFDHFQGKFDRLSGLKNELDSEED